MFNKILVGLDTNVEAQHAFDDALVLAKAANSSLTLLHVFSLDEAYRSCQLLLIEALEHPEDGNLGVAETGHEWRTIELQRPPALGDLGGVQELPQRTIHDPIQQRRSLVVESKGEPKDSNLLVESERDPLWQCILSKALGHEVEQPQILLACRAEAEKAGVQADVLPRRGKPGHILCEVAANEQFDLIAVGHRDKQRGLKAKFPELRLGSVSHYTIHHAPCSVFIAHRQVEDHSAIGSLKNMRRILAALDDSAMSQVVFKESLDLAKTTGAELTLLHVVSPSEATLSLEELHSYEGAANAVGVSTTVKQFHAKKHQSIGQVICEFAHQNQFDLILIGRRQLSEVQEQVLGSVSHYIAYHASCAVIIVQHSG